jgi:DNA-binding GntR family transcriptional regulator
MPPEEMRELIDARIVLELSAVERAMQNPYPLIDDLETALREHQRAATILGQATTPNDHAAIHRYYRADWQFHQAFLDHCHNRFINRAANELSFSNHRMRQTSKSGPTDVSVAISEHQAILDAARTADINLTRLRMLEHLENVKIRATALGGE